MACSSGAAFNQSRRARCARSLLSCNADVHAASVAQRIVRSWRGHCDVFRGKRTAKNLAFRNLLARLHTHHDERAAIVMLAVMLDQADATSNREGCSIGGSHCREYPVRHVFDRLKHGCDGLRGDALSPMPCMDDVAQLYRAVVRPGLRCALRTHCGRGRTAIRALIADQGPDLHFRVELRGLEPLTPTLPACMEPVRRRPPESIPAVGGVCRRRLKTDPVSPSES